MGRGKTLSVVLFHRTGSGGERCLGGAAVAGAGCPDREHGVGSRVLCWPSRPEQMRQLVRCCQPEAAAGRIQSQSPCRVHNYPFSLVHQHIFSVHPNDLYWLFTQCQFGVTDPPYTYIYFLTLYSNIALKRGRNSGMVGKNTLHSLELFLKPMKVFLSHCLVLYTF